MTSIESESQDNFQYFSSFVCIGAIIAETQSPPDLLNSTEDIQRAI
jgi:hypothetical protein